jgi:phosphopantothenoylcysteine decarboxylase / phosphopantothenate---cysteine ligase
MNVNMYNHPTVTENLKRLAARGVTIIDPEEGSLACGWEGKGRLCDPAAIVEELERLATPHDLTGEKILVTAGPTQEAIDPVRFVSNRSSGKMGYALARAAWRRGAQVKLIAGPSALPSPRGVDRIDTASAALMLEATSRNFSWCSALVMAAAVADFRPATVAPHKVKKRSQGMRLELAPIEDEMPRLSAHKGDRLLIGFAAETQDTEANALAKLHAKGLDLIVANDVTMEGAGFGVDTNIVTLIERDGSRHPYPQASKDEVANVILDRLAGLRKASTGKPRALRAVRRSG